MVRLVCRHLFRTGLAVWALASLVFLLSYRNSDTVIELLLADTADLTVTATPAQQLATREAVRHRLGFDSPLFYASRNTASGGWRWHGLHNQYHHWASQLLQGNLGTSFRTGQAVRSQLASALAFTLPLTATAAVLAMLAAYWLALRLAARPWWYRAVRSLLVGIHSLPLFAVALVLLLLFANPEVLAWFPAYGTDQLTDDGTGLGNQFFDYTWHFVLPITALTLSILPDFTLQLEATLGQELGADYATTARAKGLAESAVIRRHALRNALAPSITQLALLLPGLVAGAVVVEVVFALPGMGRLLAEAAAARDYPLLVGGVLLTGLARLLALLLADLLYLWADPRIRWQS
jgi:peptide/nickel transport system permease protein